AGLQRGVHVLRDGDVYITSAKQIVYVTSNLDALRAVAVLVRRGENSQFIRIRPINK
ncbi:serine peptidase, partial [Burkholderia pseudomallei]